eukprot:7242816-Pyramimonas_sp.AAC.2
MGATRVEPESLLIGIRLDTTAPRLVAHARVHVVQNAAACRPFGVRCLLRKHPQTSASRFLGLYVRSVQ